MNTSTVSHHPSRRRHRIHRPFALFVTAVAVAAGCGSEQAAIDPDPTSAVEAAAGSDRHLELLAADLADGVDARLRAAAGSDRHLELLAADLADGVDARLRAAAGSDRHLELLAADLADGVGVRLRAAARSDRHLELLADGVGARTS